MVGLAIGVVVSWAFPAVGASLGGYGSTIGESYVVYAPDVTRPGPGFVSASLDDFTAESSARARFTGPPLPQDAWLPSGAETGADSDPAPSAQRPWCLQFLPEGLIYPSYLAGVRESRFGSQWVNERKVGWIWDIALGGRVGVIRYGTQECYRPEGFQIDEKELVRFLRELKASHVARYVTREDVSWSPATGEFATFGVRYGW